MGNRTNRAAAGFTLVELMIVIAIIAILAAVALPNLMASRLTANESSAIATLRTISSAQAQARSRVSVDVDGDGIGEYLYLAELSGIANLRGVGAPMDPAAVSVAFGLVNNAAVNKSGYHFAIYLPDAANAGVPEDPNGGKAAIAAVSPDAAENLWICYAWPSDYGGSGRRAFAVGQSGDIVQTDNAVQQYSGVGVGGVVPAFDAAYAVAGDMAGGLSIGGAPGPAQDGGVWVSVN